MMMVVLTSPRTLHSAWVRTEIQIGLDLRTPMFFIHLTEPGDRPQVLLGRLTVFDYGRETAHGLARFVDHRLVWLVVYPHHRVPIFGCREGKRCPPQFGRVLVPVDARSGVSLGKWS